MIKYRTRDLLWKPAGRLVRFVIVEHPKRGHCLQMSTDLSLSALEIIELYGLRFKIEHGFKKVYRDHVHRKIKAYHVQVQAGIVAQGLMQYLSVTEKQRVRQGFGS